MKSDWRYLSLKFLGQIFKKSEGSYLPSFYPQEGAKISRRARTYPINIGEYINLQNALKTLLFAF